MEKAFVLLKGFLLYLSCAITATFFGYPPPPKSQVFQNVTIIRTLILKGIPIKSTIFKSPPTKSQVYKIVTVIRVCCYLHN